MGYQEFKRVQLNAALSEGQAKAVVNLCPLKHSPLQLSFPKGLIGTKSTGQVKIKGIDIHCLFDTGSQVTTVTLFLQHIFVRP